MFLETDLQMLIICVCHLSCSTPSTRCSETCFIGVDERLQFKELVSWCFEPSQPQGKFKESYSFWWFCLVAINVHFVLAGFRAIKFLHQSETSLRLCCKSLCILSMLSLSVLKVPSPANKSHFAELCERHRSKSFLQMPNRGAKDRPLRNFTPDGRFLGDCAIYKHAL